MIEEGCFKLLKIFKNNDFSIFIHKQSIVMLGQLVAVKKQKVSVMTNNRLSSSSNRLSCVLFSNFLNVGL